MTISDSTDPKLTAKPTRAAPFSAKIKERYSLTGNGSTKETYHISLDLKNSGIEFKVGDSVGIFGQNDPILVQHLLDAMHANGDEIVLDTRANQQISVREFLLMRANLSRLTSSFLKILHENAAFKNESIDQLLQPENKPLLADFLKQNDPLALLREYRDVKAPLQELCTQFGPMLPRFYSIASSQKMIQDEVHLTVSVTSYTYAGERRYGVASHFLCHLAEENKTPIPLYVQPTHSFVLPEKNDAHIIMIGPGTGVAPFRAFMQERIALDHSGKNWLFFGERNRKSDFFYEEFWNSLVAKQKLKLDLAFSRDTDEKVYVQHKLLENGKELWSWIQGGSHIYVCGDAEKMAKDVDAALHQIVEKEGEMSSEEAKAFVKGLRTQKRYLLDVY
ncbi:MAG: sulfite reductase [Chlamydiales bacterium]|nr:sulfite reductase [Chlamydiales bacterium]